MSPSALAASTWTLEHVLDRARPIVVRQGLTEVQAQLDRLAGHCRRRQCQVAVVGQFKRGKTSLINTLLGYPWLPTGILPVTAIPTFIHAERQASVLITFHDGHQASVEPAGIGAYISEKENPHNRKAVRDVVLKVPSPLLDAGCVLIDTPGIGSTLEHNTRATEAILPSCDAAVLVLSPDPPLTQVELDFVREVHPLVARLYFVLNKVDLVNQAELDELLEATRALLQKELDIPHLTVWTCSARTEDAGLRRLRDELQRFFREEGAAVLTRSLTLKTARLLHDARNRLDLQHAAVAASQEEWQRRTGLFAERVARLPYEQAALEDAWRGDMRRLLTALRARAAELAEAAWQDLHTALLHERDRLLDAPLATVRTALQDVADGHIGRFFDREGEAWLGAARKHAEACVERCRERAVALLDALRSAFHDIFRTTPPTVEIPAVPPFRRTFLWKTERHHGALAAGLSLTLAGLGGAEKRWQALMEACAEDYRMLCTRNANILKNHVSEALEASLTRVDRALAECLENLTTEMHASLGAAQARRASGRTEATLEEISRACLELQSLSARLMETDD